jgi:hypothetical protein
LKVVDAQLCSSAGSIPERAMTAPNRMLVRWERPVVMGKRDRHQLRIGVGEERLQLPLLLRRLPLGCQHEGQRLVIRLAGPEHGV